MLPSLLGACGFFFIMDDEELQEYNTSKKHGSRQQIYKTNKHVIIRVLVQKT